MKTLMTHDRRISQSRLKPALAPRLVVLISSPVPTIEAARINPGPIFRTACPSEGGGSWIASGGIAYRSWPWPWLSLWLWSGSFMLGRPSGAGSSRGRQSDRPGEGRRECLRRPPRRGRPRLANPVIRERAVATDLAAGHVAVDTPGRG